MPTHPSPLAAFAGARHRALLASPEGAAARERGAQWANVCESYRAATNGPRASDRTVEVQGLRFAIPDETRPGGLTARLRDGWLPWRDVANRWSVGIGAATIDIGANVGTTAVVRIVSGHAQRVYAIEPDAENFSCLVETIQANGLEGFVLPDACAISDVTGTGAFRRTDRIGNHHLVAESTPGSRHKSISVRTMTLDDWMTAYAVAAESVSFVKVDVQGWEARVLAGAPRLLAHPHVAWSLEVSPKHLEQAGTPLPSLIELIGRHFTHALDTRRKGDAIPVTVPGALAEAIAYMGPGQDESYTNLILYRAD